MKELSTLVGRLGSWIAGKPLLALVIGGAVLRVGWHLTWPGKDPPDAAIYLQGARELLAHGRMENDIYMPLYPLLVGITGQSGIIWLQIALSTLSIVLVYRLSMQIWKLEIAALLAAWLCALNPVLIYYANLRLTETTFIFLVVLGLTLLIEQRVFMGAIALVLANLTRPTLDVILPVLLASSMLTARPALMNLRQASREFGRRLFVFAAVYCVLMSPWWLHNYMKYNALVRLSLGDGIAMVLENNRETERLGGDWTTAAPWGRFSSIADPIARNNAMKAAGVAYIRERPLAWFVGSVDRLRRFLTPWPAPQVPLAVKVITALAVVPFMLGALLSLMWWRRRWRSFAPLLLVIGFLSAVHIATHALIRYRLPLDPLLMAMAAGPIAISLRALAGSGRWHSLLRLLNGPVRPGRQ